MRIRDAAINVLAELAFVIKQISLDEYCQPIPRLGNSTLGQHVRHTLEFFICLKAGIKNGVINYDVRNRDQELESLPGFALSTISSLNDFITGTNISKTLKLEVDYGLSGKEVQNLDTNFERELAYNIEHAVHHMAILKIGIREISKTVEIPEGFGIAVSTLRHRMEQTSHN